MNTLLNTCSARARTTVLLLAATGALMSTLGAGVADAANDGDTRTLVVRYDRRDLDSDRGVQVLYRRLIRASEEVCPQPSNTILPGPAVKLCRERAVAAAVVKINDGRLTAMYKALSTRPRGA